jgi:hypothetical protein
LNGENLKVERIGTNSDEEYNLYRIYLDEACPKSSEICLEVEHLAGYYRGRAFPEPLKLICGKGSIQTGDWSESEILKCYSGGLWYRKNISLSKEEIAKSIYIDLGEVTASAEVHVNGKKVGICLKKPFRLDIKDYVKEGNNYLEILVYSTLANHYSTIPTPDTYKTSFAAGLIGPLKIYSEK